MIGVQARSSCRLSSSERKNLESFQHIGGLGRYELHVKILDRRAKDSFDPFGRILLIWGCWWIGDRGSSVLESMTVAQLE